MNLILGMVAVLMVLSTLKLAIFITLLVQHREGPRKAKDTPLDALRGCSCRHEGDMPKSLS